MNRKLVKLLRRFHRESLAHMRARVQREMKLLARRGRLNNWLYQARNGWGL